MGPKKYIPLLMLIALIWVLAAPAMAVSRANIVVKTVLASQGPRYIDPNLSALIKELQSVFRYSSYRLLSQDSMKLGMREKGKVLLPGNRVLKITPVQIKGDRIQLGLVIFKKKKQIFKTVIQLLNNSSIIVGGPKHKGGYLLFVIFSSF